MSRRLEGKIPLITGAFTGIGRVTAVAFANNGAKVVVSGRDDANGQALSTELRALGVEAEFVRADVQKEDVRALVDKTIASFGRLDPICVPAHSRLFIHRSLTHWYTA